ncbi:MAG: DUF6531 domain-containing protein [Pseudomonadota bacterium]|nr:DUF6531 domain-containing protein [Pseudomonadota bacterium]
MVTTITGTVYSGTDTTGILGFPAGTDLTGKAYTLTYYFDDTKGAQAVQTCSGTPCGSSINNSGGSNPGTAVLQITGGLPWTFGNLPGASTVTSTQQRNTGALGSSIGLGITDSGGTTGSDLLNGSVTPSSGTTLTTDYNWEHAFTNSSLGGTQTLFEVRPIIGGTSHDATGYLNHSTITVSGALMNPSGKTLGDCSYCQRAGQSTAGDPVTISTGNLFEKATDYITAGANALGFSRYYNSGAMSTSNYAATLGGNWRNNYDRYLHLSPATSPTSIVAERPDGQLLTFTLSGSTWVTDSDVDYTLTNSGTTWTLKDFNDTVETYTSSSGKGTLNSLAARNTYTQTLTYSSGLLSTVTDSYSRSLGFTYTSGLLTKVTTPDSATTGITFAYTSGMLTTVTYPTATATTLTYLYENSSLPTALTGITDENGHRYETWAYDTQGRATSSKAGDTLGANLTTVTYNSGGTVTVTNAFGVADTYTFSTLQGVPKVTGIARASTSTTVSATRTLAYDTNGYLNSSTDWNGNTTTLVNNSHGLPTTINEAVSSSPSVARTTTIAYDTTWVHLPATVTQTGMTTTYAYDTSGNVHTKTETDSTTGSTPYSSNGTARTWTNTYSSTGQLQTVTGPRTDVTQVTTYGYTGGTLTSLTDALSHVTTINTHTNGGLPTQVTDPNSVVTNLTYDGRQRLLTSGVVTGGGTLTTTYLYDSAGELTKTTLPDGSYIANSYDNAHRLTRVTNANSEYINYTLDALGDRTATNTYNASSTLKRSHSATFDALGRMLTDVGGMSQTTTYAYDNNGNATSITDPLTHATTQTFDALNRRSQITDRLSGLTKFTYDTFDRVLTVIDPNTNTTTYTRDGFGRSKQILSPDSGTSVYHYDLADDLTQKTDGASIVTNHTYDKLNRELTRTFPAHTAENVSKTYDQTGTVSGFTFTFGIGHLTTLVDSAGTANKTYDERGNALHTMRVDSYIQDDIYTYYDDASRIIAYETPSQWSIQYSRDAAGQVNSIGSLPPGVYSGPTAIISSIVHLPFGPVSSFSYANGINRTTTFDADYRQTLLKDLGTATIQNLTYAYNANDNVTSITDAVNAANTQTLGYDVLDRLNSAVASGTGGYGTMSWTYDANGNRKTEVSGGTTVTYTTTSGTNKLASITTGSTNFTYNGAGENTLVKFGTTLNRTYAFDKSERLSTETYASMGSAAITNLFDVDGHRQSKAGNVFNTYNYGEDGSFMEEYNTVGQVTDYVYLDGIPVALLGQVTSGGTTTETTYYVHCDRLGTPQYVTNPSKTIVWKDIYKPFGLDSVTNSGGITQNLRFLGQFYDSETEVLYNGARFYYPVTGRYIQTDPIGLAGGTNTYAYADNNPFSFVDPTGTQEILLGGRLPPWLEGLPEETLDSFKEPIEGLSGKEGAKDVPSWCRGLRPKVRENGNDFADRLMNDKYGEGNWDKSNPEYNQIKKWGNRSFRVPRIKT